MTWKRMKFNLFFGQEKLYFLLIFLNDWGGNSNFQTKPLSVILFDLLIFIWLVKKKNIEKYHCMKSVNTICFLLLSLTWPPKFNRGQIKPLQQEYTLYLYVDTVSISQFPCILYSYKLSNQLRYHKNIFH